MDKYMGRYTKLQHNNAAKFQIYVEADNWWWWLQIACMRERKQQLVRNIYIHKWYLYVVLCVVEC